MVDATKPRATRDLNALPPVPVLGGLTASGKTALALALGRAYPITVISADAMMVYRGLDIGTAKPTWAERQSLPHLLLDELEVNAEASVAWWAERAETEIRAVVRAGRVPLVVGGTGFYIQALTLGRPSVPPSDPEHIRELEGELARVGLPTMIARLVAADEGAAGVAQGNPRRVLRALEVIETTGRPPADFGRHTPGFAVKTVALAPPLDVLEPRIERRAHEMFESGLAVEAAWLRSRVRTGSRRPTALQAIGYREALQVLDGELTVERAEAAIALATRRYAKRQRTWFAKQPGVKLVSEVKDAAEALRSLLDAWLTGLCWPDHPSC